MTPLQRLRNHIITLNSVCFNDEAGQDSFLYALADTIQALFGQHHQYMTYLRAICFRPVFIAASQEDAVRSWAEGKKQLRDLLLVMLNDRLTSAVDEGKAGFEIGEAERIVARHVGVVDEDLSVLPRIRIDLRDVNILDEEVAGYLLRTQRGPLDRELRKVLFFSSPDIVFDQRVLRVLKRSAAQVTSLADYGSLGKPKQELLADHKDAAMVVMVLGAESPSPATCFLLGYLVALFGRNSVVVLYQESERFVRPTMFFDVLYLPVDASEGWERDLLSRMKSNQIDIKEPQY